jgi:hypothetical protein
MTTLVTSLTDTRTAEQRWADWIARGVAQDRISHRRAVNFAMGVGCAIAVGLAIAFMRG